MPCGNKAAQLARLGSPGKWLSYSREPEDEHPRFDIEVAGLTCGAER